VGQRAGGQRLGKGCVLVQMGEEGGLDLHHSIVWGQREMVEFARYFGGVRKGPNSHPIVWRGKSLEDDSQV